VDDGSSDDTAAQIALFTQRHPDIVIEYHWQKNAGPSAARNLGLSLAQAEFVAMLDADDIWRKDKLAKQLDLFVRAGDKSPLGVVYCQYDLINQDGTTAHNKGFQLDPRVRGNVYRRLLGANLIAGSASAVLIRRDFLLKAGLFDERLVCAEDWDLWLRLARLCHYDYVNEPLLSIRQHPNNSQKNEHRMLGGELLFLDKLYRSGHMGKRHLWRIRRRLVLGKIDPIQLEGFVTCAPRLQKKLSGWRLDIAAHLIRAFYRLRSLPRAIRKRLPGGPPDL